jgi:tetratricopeptide (TPR) repeat protein
MTMACGAGCVLSLVLAAGSKETGFAGPFLLVLYAWLFRRAIPRRAWGILIAAAFAAVFLFAAARFGLQPAASKIFTEKPVYLGGSLGQIFSIQPRIWAFLIANTTWPLHLSADYGAQNVAWISWKIAFAVLAVLLVIQIFLSFKSRLALFGTFIFWAGLAPVSNFIPIYRPIGDRFLYMPMAGLAALLCAAILLVHSRLLFALLVSAAFVAESAFASLTWQRQAVFANPLNLWRDTVAKSPFSVTAADNFGYALSNAGKYDEALSAFGRALRLTREHYADAWAGAAITLDRMGRTSDANASLQKAVAIDPRYASPRELVESMTEDADTAAAIEKILARMPGPTPSP